MKSIRIVVTPVRDQVGEWEEFTWDLVPVIPAEKTLHLQSTGLPKVGTFVPPGGILVGKIGKTKAFRIDNLPNALDMHGLEFDALKVRFGSMWYDASCYATTETAGIVVDSHFEPLADDVQRAVVEIDTGSSVSPVSTAGSTVSSAVSGKN